MQTAATLLTAISGVEHIYFFVLEALMWKKPLGLKTFRMDAQKAEATAQLAVNQGFYNLFLAAGLFWACATPIDSMLRLYTLAFVIAAALVGGATVNMRILIVQGTPAIVGFVLTLLAR